MGFLRHLSCCGLPGSSSVLMDEFATWLCGDGPLQPSCRRCFSATLVLPGIAGAVCRGLSGDAPNGFFVSAMGILSKLGLTTPLYGLLFISHSIYFRLPVYLAALSLTRRALRANLGLVGRPLAISICFLPV